MVEGDVERIKRGLYVDNFQFTSSDDNELVHFFFEANKIFAQAHLYLNEWMSNNDSLQTIAKAYGISAGEQTAHKVLGLNWDKEKGTLTLQQTKINNSSQTKREVLRTVARIYDPIRVLLPVTIRARIYLQNLWKQQLDWDEQLPDSLQNRWVELSEDLEKCLDIFFPRNTSLGKGDSLHIFCDASELAYGCVAYRVKKENSHLMMTKARVAPIKELTVPKLELMALLLAARLAKFIEESFEKDEFVKLFVLSDSKVTLSWSSISMKRHGELTLEELQEAKNKTIAVIQREYFQEEYESLMKGEDCSQSSRLRGLTARHMYCIFVLLFSKSGRCRQEKMIKYNL
ncbi:uncharacterized protein [Macrobrachium rosenbergii]|uniref:uncharacterized protein n=1 Tax=Macrobrachium rosenbergii TaxID=79674 RepID=UPI0034D46F86